VGKIWLPLIIMNNAIIKNGDDDFTKLLQGKDRTANPMPNFKSYLFFAIIGMLSNCGFMSENLFKIILKDKKIDPEYGFEKIIEQIISLTKITSDQQQMLKVFRLTRNSLHNAFIHNNKREPYFSHEIDGYTFTFKENEKINTQWDDFTKIILEYSKIINDIINQLYPEINNNP